MVSLTLPLIILAGPKEDELIAAVGSGDVAKVKALVEVGVDVNAADEQSVSVLMRAAEGRHDGDTDIVKILVGAKANVNAADDHDQTALMIAARCGKPAIVKLLVEADAAVNAVDESGSPALLYAASGGYTEIVKFLLQSKALVNVKNRQNQTALMVAAEAGYFEVVAILVAAGGQSTGTLEEANRFNNSGMEAYKKKRYKEAARWFTRAIAASVDHKLAGYNLACTYALARGACGYLEDSDGSPFDGNLSNEIILRQLEMAIKIDPKAREFARKDPDFEKVKNDIAFLKLVGALPAPADNAAWQKILTSRQYWYLNECGGGAFGCSHFSFKIDGTFEFYKTGHMCTGDAGCIPEEPKTMKGTYEVKNARVLVIFESGQKDTYVFPGLNNSSGKTPEKELLENNPDPCSA